MLNIFDRNLLDIMVEVVYGNTMYVVIICYYLLIFVISMYNVLVNHIINYVFTFADKCIL